METLGVRRRDFESGSKRPLEDVYKSYSYFAEGDVLLAKITPCFENGKLGIAAGLANGVGFGSSEYFVFRCGPRLLPEFLFYFLSQESVIEAGVASMGGAVGHQRVPLWFVENLRMQLPPLSEQERIAAMLDEAFAAIDTATANAKKNLANAEELYGSTLESMLGDESTGWVQMQVGELMQSGWLVDHMDGNHGSAYPRKHEFIDAGVPYISANSIIDGRVDMSRAKYLSVARASKLRKGFAQDGDVLFAHNATVGPVALLRTAEPMIVLGTSLTYYRCNDEFLSARYLAHFLRSSSFVRQYQRVMRQSTRNQVPITKQRTFNALIPSRQEQDEISDLLDAMLDKVDAFRSVTERRLVELSDLRQSILGKVIRGELHGSEITEDRILADFTP